MMAVSRLRSYRQAVAWAVSIGAGGVAAWQGFAFGARLGGMALGVLVATVFGVLAAMMADEAADRLLGR